MQPKSDLPQGTLDLLILKIVALGRAYGYAIAQRLRQTSRDVVQIQQGSLYPARCIGWRAVGSWLPNGEKRIQVARPSFIGSPAKAERT